MLKGSTLSLGASLVVGSAVLAGLWVMGPRLFAPTRKPVAAVVEAPVAPAGAKAQAGVRSVYPGLVSGAAPSLRGGVDERASSPQTASREGPSPAPLASRGSSDAASAPAGAGPAPEIAAADPNAGIAPAAGAPSPEGAPVDLNSGSVEDLNRLGAGMIGRRIVGGRPYASPEELVTRRVLTRKDFDRIKTQVVVQSPPAAP